MAILPRPYEQIEGDVPPLPAYLRSTLDQTVKTAMGKATSALDVAQDITSKRRIEGVKAADRIEANIARSDEIMKRLEDRKPDVEAPTYDPQPFTPPEAQYDPFEAFGSLASIMGVIGSLAARRPLTAALTASAAVMNAYKQNDLEAYTRSFEEWKESSELAAKKAEFDYDIYRTSFDLMKTDMMAAEAQIRGLAAQNDDIPMMAILRSGNLEDAMKMFNARQKYATDMPKLNKEILKRGLMAQGNLEFFKENERWPNFQETNDIIKTIEQSLDPASGSALSVYKLETAQRYDRALEAADLLPEGPEKDAAIEAAEEERKRRQAGMYREYRPLARTQKIDDLMQTYGFDRQKAVAFADGLIKVKFDNFSGKWIMFDVLKATDIGPASAKEVEAAKSVGAVEEVVAPSPSEAAPVSPSEVPSEEEFGKMSLDQQTTLWNQVSRAIGPVSSFWNVVSRIPYVGNAFNTSQMVQARNYINVAKRSFIASLQTNPRYADAERKAIEAEIEITPGAWDNPKAFKDRLIGITESLKQRRSNYLAKSESDKLSRDQRSVNAEKAIDMELFLRTLGVPLLRFYTVEEAEKEIPGLASGTRFILPNGAMAVKQ